MAPLDPDDLARRALDETHAQLHQIFARIIDNPRLEGLCAMASMTLLGVLHVVGLDGAELVVGRHLVDKLRTTDGCTCHVWVEYRGRIYDVTAAQYEAPGAPAAPLVVATTDARYADVMHRGEMARGVVLLQWDGLLPPNRPDVRALVFRMVEMVVDTLKGRPRPNVDRIAQELLS